MQSADGQSCTCAAGYKTTYDISGTNLAQICVECQGGDGVTNDKSDCIPCGQANRNNGQCICADSRIFVDRDDSGQLLASGLCVACSANRIGDGDTCDVCDGDLAIPTGEDVTGTCECEFLKTENGNNVCFVTAEAQSKIAVSNVKRAGSDILSPLIQHHIYTAYRECLEMHSSPACNQLANFCTLQLIELNSACSLLDYIELKRSRVEGHAKWVQNTPWLKVELGDMSAIESDTAIATTYTFADTLNIVSAAYDVNGTFLGYFPVEHGFLQLCKFPESHLHAAWSFGAPQSRTCSLSPGAIFRHGPVRFYELFVKYETENREYLYPVIIQQTCDSTCTLPTALERFRRFFMVDTISTIEAGKTEPSVVRFAKSVHLKVKLRSQGQIYPPILELTYSDISITDDDVAVTFAISYFNSDTVEAENEQAWTVTIGVLVPIFVIISIIPFVSWNRRNGTGVLDGTMIVKFLLALIDGVAWAFLIVVFGFSFYWFLENNGDVPTDVPSDKQNGLFKALISLAFIFKAIDVLHIIIRQAKLDVFFIDWEREKALAEGGVGKYLTYFLVRP